MLVDEGGNHMGQMLSKSARGGHHRSSVGRGGDGETRLARICEAYLAATLPGGEYPSGRATEALLATSPICLAELDHHRRRVVGAALILARARSGSVEEAVELADAETDLRLVGQDAGVIAATLAVFWSAASEAYATAGLARQGTQAAYRAHEYALDSGSDAQLYRAYGLLAANRALNGEFIRAENVSAKAATLEQAHAWEHTAGAYMLLVGRIMVASAQMDTVGLDRCARRVRRTLPDDPTWRALAALADATRLLLDSRPSEGIAVLVPVTNGADQQAIPALIRDMMISLHATLLVARGEPQRALSLLEGRESSPDHTLCFDLQRASAYLRLGDDRSVLMTTDHCIHFGPRHCLRTLPPVLLRRAVANERLGHHRTADTTFADAFHLMRSSGSTTPLHTLSHAEIDTLLARFLNDRPDLSAAVGDLRRRMQLAPSARPPSQVVPPLSKREAIIARRLRDPGTLSDIAASLCVARNTVKTQVRSLYRKLGVSTREDAIAVLEGTGFYDLPHAEQETSFRSLDQPRTFGRVTSA
ncbi:helix-turn-helix transcriptional regulator [Raineyella sp. W15-4]|uniref:helix-turn-helix transcriptional regulator n=1 Tax=Raineyella sp. W15-4 TaxID=3081651 RepID=UPI002954660E|nr:helix-turn-helix transcriptional regulator [Raineyella sp. W15-4]WOQ16067.1 helix-turn-helix transcriptional regulator [Raineyella sp. W15-4]